MARPALRKVGRPEEAGPRLAHLDRDRPLVEAAQADPARFEALYRKYLAQVYSYAFYELRDHHEAEDATERTFLAALANLRRFEERARPADGDGASTFRVWLFQIARNAVAERRRAAASPSGGRRSTPPLDVAARDRPGTRGDRSATRPGAALGAIARLPGDRRRALILRFVDEMSTAEIAGVLGRSEGAVRVLIHRALRSVARDLDDGAPVTGRRAAGTAARSRRSSPTGISRRSSRPTPAAPTGAPAPDRPAMPGCASPPTGSRGTCRASIRRSGSRRPWPRVADRGRAGSRLPVAAGARGVRSCRCPIAADPSSPRLWTARRSTTRTSDRVRPLLIGGALTSAALSLAGAAYVAWRLTRPAGEPDGPCRSRAVARTRLA